MYTFETFQTFETKKLGILMIPNPFINNHINAHGATRVDQTLSEVPKYAVVDLADGSDGETRHRQRHACNKHKCRRPYLKMRNESVHNLHLFLSTADSADFTDLLWKLIPIARLCRLLPKERKN